jgi:CheY-like chemotaxis protein
VVDNDSAIRQAMSALLAGWGYQVVAAAGLADLPALTSSQVDVLVVDYHLDGAATGLDLAKTLRTNYRRLHPTAAELPVVMITADQSPELRHLLQQEQGHLLYKPVRPLKLRSLLRALIQQR